MTAGVSLIPGKAGAHRAPLQLGSEFCRLNDEALRCRTNVVEGIARHEGDGILRLGFQDISVFGSHDRRRNRAEGFHQDRKSTRLNSSHVAISYAVFCLKKKK